MPPLPPLHTSLQNQSAGPMYSEHFLPARYNDYEGLAPGEYSYGGMRLFDLPLELDQTLLKTNIGFTNGHVTAPANVGRLHDSFRSGSPPSSDNSPLSMSLSISSGTSSEGGRVENQDLVATPVVFGAVEPVQIQRRQL